ncbi:hypothetical protein ACFU5P_26160 [Streptomyces sp. NPDC057433]|uniref:hypothetical protein n=1 Tax=Streptomyces sp. NPDC057433 TaxID=3346132 RepID=UPI0036A6B468
MPARLGKDGNRQAGVPLHLASDGASAAVDRRLFLPESRDPASPKFCSASSIAFDPARRKPSPLMSVASRTDCRVDDRLARIRQVASRRP